MLFRIQWRSHQRRRLPRGIERQEFTFTRFELDQADNSEGMVGTLDKNRQLVRQMDTL